MDMAESDRQDLVKLMISVARIEGMLTQALGDQASRIERLEQDKTAVHIRLNEKRAKLVAHDEQIVGLQKAVNALENARVSTLGRVGIVLASTTGVGGMILALYNAMRIGG